MLKYLLAVTAILFGVLILTGPPSIEGTWQGRLLTPTGWSDFSLVLRVQTQPAGGFPRLVGELHYDRGAVYPIAGLQTGPWSFTLEWDEGRAHRSFECRVDPLSLLWGAAAHCDGAGGDYNCELRLWR